MHDLVGQASGSVVKETALLHRGSIMHDLVGQASGSVVKETALLHNRFFQGRYLEEEMKTRDFRPLSRFILETIQDWATVTMEDDQELKCCHFQLPRKSRP